MREGLSSRESLEWLLREALSISKAFWRRSERSAHSSAEDKLVRGVMEAEQSPSQEGRETRIERQGEPQVRQPEPIRPPDPRLSLSDPDPQTAPQKARVQVGSHRGGRQA